MTVQCPKCGHRTDRIVPWPLDPAAMRLGGTLAAMQTSNVWGVCPACCAAVLTALASIPEARE